MASDNLQRDRRVVTFAPLPVIASGSYTVAAARVLDRLRWSACYTPTGSMLVGDGTRQARPHQLIGCFDSELEAKQACRDHHENKRATP